MDYLEALSVQGPRGKRNASTEQIDEESPLLSEEGKDKSQLSIKIFQLSIKGSLKSAPKSLNSSKSLTQALSFLN